MPAVALRTNDLESALSIKLDPPRAPLPATFLQQHGVFIAILLASAIIVLVLLARIARRKHPVIQVAPAKQARTALAGLRGHQPDPALASETARIVRRFVVARLGLPPVELTTAEIRDQLRNQHLLARDIAESIAGFLQRCDSVSFGPGPVPAGEDPVAEALLLIQRVEPADEPTV